MSVAVAVAPGAHSAAMPPEATITRDGDFAGPLAPGPAYLRPRALDFYGARHTITAT
jgi:hypothetical protein